MKLLFDQNLSPKLVNCLADLFSRQPRSVEGANRVGNPGSNDRFDLRWIAESTTEARALIRQAPPS